MAKKRMFRLDVLETDAFMDMPLSAQALYFHLCMRADDDGFIGNPKRITANVGASIDDLRVLIAKRFLLTFEDGVVVVKHWRMHNAIKKDRYTETNFIEDLRSLKIKENGAYTFSEISGAQLEHKWSTDGAQMSQTCSTDIGIDIGKDKDIDKYISVSDKPKRFQKPTIDELKTYIDDQGYNVDAEKFYDFYEAKGWMIGKNHMKDWKAAVRTWNSKEKPKEEDLSWDDFRKLKTTD